MSKILRAWVDGSDEKLESVLTGEGMCCTATLVEPNVMAVYGDGRLLFECTVPVSSPVGKLFEAHWNGERWKFTAQ